MIFFKNAIQAGAENKKRKSRTITNGVSDRVGVMKMPRCIYVNEKIPAPLINKLLLMSNQLLVSVERTVRSQSIRLCNPT